MKTDFILGIDPGLHGAIALYDTREPQLVEVPRARVWDMPINDNGVDPAALANLIWEIDGFTCGTLSAAIENVNSRPRQQGAFAFGLGCGILQGVLAAFDVPVTLITPTTWKGGMGLRRRIDESQDENKDRARALATQIFPEMADSFKRKKDDGRAEALLLAVYAANRKEKR